MSEENVELARSSYEAFNQRDQEAFLALMDETVEAGSRLAAVEGVYRGHEGIRRWWSDLIGVFPDYRLEIQEVRDLGEITLTHFTASALGIEDRMPFIDPAWLVARWRDGKCVWWRVCLTEAEALEAAGLAE
jgi:ketosteroid isomerase-like protein